MPGDPMESGSKPSDVSFLMIVLWLEMDLLLTNFFASAPDRGGHQEAQGPEARPPLCGQLLGQNVACRRDQSSLAF